MTLGRVGSADIHQILRKELGSVTIRFEPRGVTVWSESPNLLLGLIRAALARRTSVDFLPGSFGDLTKIDKSEWNVPPPHVVPYYPHSGERLKVFSGVRPTRRKEPRAKLFLDTTLGKPSQLRHKP